MKNFFKNIVEYIKEHKAIIIAVSVVLIVPLITYGLLSDKPTLVEKKADKTYTEKKVAEESKTKENKTDEVKAEEEIKAEDSKKEVTESKTETKSENKSTEKSKSTTSKSTTPAKPAANNSKPAVNNSSGSNSTPPAKKKVWIVDKAAWTETIKTPVYEDVDVYNLYATNRETRVEELLGKYYTYADTSAAMDAIDDNKYVNVRFSVTGETKIVRYDTKTINHPEEGHWEYK